MDWDQQYKVVQYSKAGDFVAVVSGLGRHRGTLDSSHGRRTAQRHARQLRLDDSAHDYRVESNVG